MDYAMPKSDRDRVTNRNDFFKTRCPHNQSLETNHRKYELT